MIYISKLSLTNFRCYSQSSWAFINGINIVIGNNATGKTSLMEAICMLGMCKSYRTNNEKELIKQNSTFYSLQAEYYDDENSKKNSVSIVGTTESKKIAMNEKVYKSFSEYLGMINVVLFSPEDLRLVKGEPKYKRRFLDLNIGQIDKEYLKSLMEYNRVLKERNEFLKQIAYDGKELSPVNKTLLGVYTNTLEQKAYIIIEKREKFIDLINKYIKSKINVVSQGKEEGYLVYKPNVKKNEVKKELLTRERFDLFSQTTSVGPHRDDFEVILNGQDASSFGSQGQQRTIALAIKLGLADLIKEKNKNVIVILDDVFGELDNNRQKDLIKLLKTDNQIFITTTSESYLLDEVLKNSNIIRIEE